MDVLLLWSSELSDWWFEIARPAVRPAGSPRHDGDLVAGWVPRRRVRQVQVRPRPRAQPLAQVGVCIPVSTSSSSSTGHFFDGITIRKCVRAISYMRRMKVNMRNAHVYNHLLVLGVYVSDRAASALPPTLKAKSEYNLDLFSSVQRARFFCDFTIACFFGCQYGIP